MYYVQSFYNYGDHIEYEAFHSYFMTMLQNLMSNLSYIASFSVCSGLLVTRSKGIGLNMD